MDIFDMNSYKVNTLVVHTGVFHSDDVFCAAAMKILNPQVAIRRITDEEKIETEIEAGIIVADIGMGPFDHHQKDCPDREDGIRHCGASRVWLVFGASVVRSLYPDISDEDCELACRGIYSNMLRTIAALDNGDDEFPKNVYSIVNIVEGFRPAWNSDKTYDQGFAEAVEFVKMTIIHEIHRYVAEAASREYVRERVALMEEGIVILEKYCPWKKVVVEEEKALSIVYPSIRGGWYVEPVPVEYKGVDEVKYRIHFPDSWRGIKGEEAASLWPGLTFCHVKGFLSAFDTKEHAVAAAKWLNRNC